MTQIWARSEIKWIHGMEIPQDTWLQSLVNKQGVTYNGTRAAVFKMSPVTPDYMSNLFIRWPRWTLAREAWKR